jgi:hypothetical protein
MGNKRLAINSSALEDKNMGVQMLYQYTTDMGVAFAPFVDAVTDCLTPLLVFKYMHSTRIACAATMPRLIEIAVEAEQRQQTAPGSAQAVLLKVVPALLSAMETEATVLDSLEALCVMGDCVAEVLKIAHQSHNSGAPGGLHGGRTVMMPVETLPAVIGMLSKMTELSMSRRCNRNDLAAADEDFDEEAMEAMQVWCALCTVCAVYCVCCVLCVLCAVCTVYRMCCVLCAVYCVCCVLCAVCAVCAVCCVFCALCVPYVLCAVCAVCSVLCTVCTVYCVLYVLCALC